MLPLYVQLTETRVDNFSIKHIFFNFLLSSCISSCLILFMLAIVNAGTPRLTVGAMLSLMTLLVLTLSIECAHNIIFWLLVSHEIQGVLEQRSL